MLAEPRVFLKYAAVFHHEQSGFRCARSAVAGGRGGSSPGEAQAGEGR